MSDIKIASGYVPGSIGRVAELHGTYYHDQWGFGFFFEAKCATDLSEFLKRYDEKRDGFWTALLDGRVEGHIAIDGVDAEGKGAHLRYFIVSDALRGKGIGNRLIRSAIDFCRNSGHKRVYLWTFEGLSLRDTSTRRWASDSLNSAEDPSGGWRSTNSGSNSI
jgi:GNAT superfamily N-acetyltransferase